MKGEIQKGGKEGGQKVAGREGRGAKGKISPCNDGGEPHKPQSIAKEHNIATPRTQTDEAHNPAVIILHSKQTSHQLHIHLLEMAQVK